MKRKFFLVMLFGINTFVGCKKQAPSNQEPVVNAGADIRVVLPTDSVTLNGTGTDPDGIIVSYYWRLISGPSPGRIINPNSAATMVTDLVEGVYEFELTVTDNGGLSAKDRLVVTVLPASSPGGPCLSKEYGVDIQLDTTFTFIHNYYDPWDYGPPDPDSHYDLTEVMGTGFILPFGEFNINIQEYADSSASNATTFTSYFEISKGTVNPLIISGFSSIFFKKLIMQGGGTFNGTFTITYSSAGLCNATNLTPLTVTGSLNVSAHTISLRIKGSAYF